MGPHDLSRERATRTLGIDLASQPSGTGVCAIDWTETPARVAPRGAEALTDEILVELMSDPRVSRVAIDTPFGWPVEFVNALVAYRDDGSWPARDDPTLRYRATERYLRELQRPLSASTDQLVWPTMRCARLLDLWARRQSLGVDRTGQGRFVEVYPAAALRRWGLSPADSPDDPGSYKGPETAPTKRRERLVASLRESMVGVVELTDDFAAACIISDDQLDALVCALVARAVELGRSDSIPPDALERARREGWIHVPAEGPVSEALRPAGHEIPSQESG